MKAKYYVLLALLVGVFWMGTYKVGAATHVFGALDAANVWTGIQNFVNGITINGTATLGNILRGNGTAFVSAPAGPAGVLDASIQSGADMCAKIASAWGVAIAAGVTSATVDARGFTGIQPCAGSMWANYPDDSTFTGTLWTQGVNIVTNVSQVMPSGAVWDGFAGRPYPGPPYSSVGRPGTILQASTTFPTSTPLVEYTSAGGTGYPMGQRLKNLEIECIPTNGAFIAGSIGVRNTWAQEKAGANNIRIDSCAVGLEVESSGANDSGSWEGIMIERNLTPNTTVCVKYSSNDATGTAMHSMAFRDITCAGGNTTQPLVNFNIDGSGFELDGYYGEDAVNQIEIGANHSAFSATLVNVSCKGSVADVTTNCIHFNTAHPSTGVSIIGLDAPVGHVTNLVKDELTNGYTIPVTSGNGRSLARYIQDNGCVQTSNATYPTIGCGTELNPVSVFTLKDDFPPGAGTSGQIGELGWVLRAIGTPNGGQQVGTWPNLGIFKAQTGSTAGNLDALTSDLSFIGTYGALGQNTGWDSTFIFALSQTTLTRFRIGFVEGNGAASCSAVQETSISTNSGNCDGIWLRYDTNAPTAATVAADNATCASAGACRDATGTIATFLTGAHGFTLVGQTVTIAGVTDTSFNGACVVATIPDTTHFTCPNAGTASAHSGSGTATPVADTTFKFETKSGTTATVVDTLVNADTSFHRLRVRSTTAGHIFFTLSDATGLVQKEETEIAGTVPTTNLGPMMQIVSDTGAVVSKAVAIDYFGFKALGLER